MQTIRITVTNEDGVILDTATHEVEDGIQTIGYRLLDTQYSGRGDELELNITRGPNRGE